MRLRIALAFTIAAAFQVAAADVFQTLAPSIVRVRSFVGETVLKDGSGLVREDYEYGTGFAVEDSLVVTAKHTVVVDKHQSKAVHCWSPVRKRYEGCTIVYVSPDRDIAVLWYPELPKPRLSLIARAIPLGVSLIVAGFPDTPYAQPRLVVGQGVLLSWSTAAPGGEHLADRRKLASVDAVAFPGCSGGPVLTEKLDVVGMVVSIMENDEGQWNGTTYLVRAEDIRAALNEARKSIQQKKGYEFLPSK